MTTHEIHSNKKRVKPFTSLIFSISLVFISVSVYGAEKRNIVNNINTYSFEELAPRLHQQTDSLYVINFWATWCAPCVKEIPAFEKIQAEYADKKVKVLFVSLDFPGQIKSRLIPFIDKMNMEAEVVLLDEVDGNKWIPKVDDNWSGAIPATLIYNSEKREFYAREFTYEELQETLHTFLNIK